MSDLGEKPEDVAAREGLALVVPGPRELFVDLDSPEACRLFAKLLGTARSQMGPAAPCEQKRTTSRNGGTHVYLAFDRDLSDFERVAWQAVLGSDPMRELLSMLRIELALPIPPTVFFEVEGADQGGDDGGF